MKQKKRVVIFLFIKDQKILIEKRYLKNFGPDQYLIPGGGVKENIEDLEQALKREIVEELGIIPLEFTPLPTEERINGLNNQILIPYLINKWEGDFPTVILDKGNPLIWLTIDEVLNSPIIPTRKIIEALKNYLSKNDTSQT